MREPIWPQVATALERAADSGFDLTDDLPNMVNGQWVASLRLMHDAGLYPTDSATEPAPATLGQTARVCARAQKLATTPSKPRSTSARSQ
jgi:hypothetical protein